ncbi:SRPBCC family protein [Pseudonocardia nantongensis]|uniref:SRPBCC family protein n=1 Tax=Pseudonocardia nantongensis TaxID=1181885 RepID=UPI0039789346
MTGPAGAVVRRPDGRSELAFRREFPDRVDDVWAAVTDPDRCARWFGRWTGDARPGGTVMLTMTSAEDGGGPPEAVRIVDCVPPHRLAVTIGVPDAGPPWEITAELAADRDAPGGGTVLEFRQVLADGFSPADAGPGWHWYLDRLAAVLSGGPMPGWEATLAATGPLYPR